MMMVVVNVLITSDYYKDGKNVSKTIAKAVPDSVTFFAITKGRRRSSTT
jgi:hypothetical protein